MFKNLKKGLSTLLLSCLLVSNLFTLQVNGQQKNVTPKPTVTAKKVTLKNTPAKPANKQPVQNPNQAKNVIIFLGDGMGVSHTTLARLYKGSNLYMDEIATGLVKTYCYNSIITDSAPAATAMATGYKSNDGYISVYPSEINYPSLQSVNEKDAYKPLATVLEAAKLKNKATGIVSTSQVSHASPAGFTAHVPNRNQYFEIAKQQVYQNLNVVFGGGKKYLLPGEKGRQDGLNLIDELKKMNYQFVEDTKSMKSANGEKIWGIFADDAMSHDIDRDPEKEPSLAEMTRKAIELLSKDKDGFFLFVEGSEIDWASHANDPKGVISDVLAYDEAIKVALDFAKKDKNTLIIAAADHDNGGLSIGNKKTDSTYTTLKANTLLDPLKKATLTGVGVESKLNPERDNIVEVMRDYYGITDLTAEEIEAIKKAPAGKLNYVIGPMLSSRSVIGWTTNGHTGSDTVLYAYGPGKPSGVIDNTDIAKIAAKAMGISLNDVNADLFVELEEGLTYLPNAEAELDVTDMANPVLIITKGKIVAELPISTNIIKINGKVKYLNGLTILAKNERIYLPIQALDIIFEAK
ncbi:alkaline phosphatase [Fervidicella metallireducens AeB]|uniref:Alkaline phosphatase n=1 Tax=Fervidicella metallireducens AeB TaxID=1403537 RepID=A0A017RWI9_9CLOT|nr:alkaline phosphatase [Fervidicella metallireducens]EYE89123.1 alkaline phosphatase [Fervidicella metallireducens AeB]